MGNDIKNGADEKPGGSTPSQYGLPESATDLQDLIEYREMNFAQGNIFKAQYRRGTCSHSDELRDARKTLWFAQREVDRLEALVAEDGTPWVIEEQDCTVDAFVETPECFGHKPGSTTVAYQLVGCPRCGFRADCELETGKGEN